VCLAIPGKVLEVADDGLVRHGKVDFSGVRRDVCLAYTPEAEVGDYVLVHVGFAISTIDEDEAQTTLETLAAYAAAVEPPPG
jgi:hydrogenase expression/formation protein HypC